MSEGTKIKDIEIWLTKLRKLLAMGSRRSIAEDMPGLQKELQSLAGDGELGKALGPQLKAVLAQLAEGLKTEVNLQEPLSEEEEQLQQMVHDFRPEVENLLTEIGPGLTPQEAAMFEMTQEIVANNCQLRQFENALQLLQQSWHKASEIQKEMRGPVEPPPEPEVDLEALVQAATQELGKLLAPWGPLLSPDDQIQFAFYASLLNQCLKKDEFGPALGLIGSWAGMIEELPRQHRERLLGELDQYESPAEAQQPEWAKVQFACEAVRKELSGGKPKLANILESQKTLDAIPQLVQAAHAAIQERLRCELLWKKDLEEATKSLKDVLNKLDKGLHGELQKQLLGESISQQYVELRKQKVAGNYAALNRQLVGKVKAISVRMNQIAQALQKARDEDNEKQKVEAENAPQEISDIGPLLLACVPAEGEDNNAYLGRKDVTDFLGNNWLSFDAQALLASALNPEPPVGNNDQDDVIDQEGGGWTVTNDNPRVYFTDRAALDKASAIIKKTKAGADPRKAATEEGCSTPTWYGDMLEIRLTQGGTQLRLIANNLGNKQLEFTEVKSFHAAGDKKAGNLKDYD
jgi:hypothetical protein